MSLGDKVRRPTRAYMFSYHTAGRMHALSFQDSRHNMPRTQAQGQHPWTLMGRELRAPEHLSPAMQQKLIVALIPDLASRVQRLNPNLVKELHADGHLAAKLAQMKEWLPTANISEIVARRPDLLLDINFVLIPPALERLQSHFPADMVEGLVAAQPWLLDERSDDWLQSLQRLLQIQGSALASMLLQRPGLLFAAQSGRHSLGPGAEFPP